MGDVGHHRGWDSKMGPRNKKNGLGLRCDRKPVNHIEDGEIKTAALGLSPREPPITAKVFHFKARRGQGGADVSQRQKLNRR